MEAYLKTLVQQSEGNKDKPKQPGLFETLFWGPQVTDGLHTMYISNEFGLQGASITVVK